MKIILSFLIIGLSLVICNKNIEPNSTLITRENLEELKSKAKFDVIDFENHPFKNLTKHEIIHKLGLMKTFKGPVKHIEYGDSSNLPLSFHYIEKWPQCYHFIRDQQSCGACWAFAASEVLSDRLCIATDGLTNVVLSPQDMVSCDSSEKGCSGGLIDKSWDYIRDYGIVTEDCLPYTSGNGNPGICPFTTWYYPCVTGTYRKYRVSSHGQFLSISEAKNSIYTEGPIEAGFIVYSDLMSYKGGVYRRTSNESLGGHAVKIVGWGVDYDGTEYWIIANSWNTTWGENGYLRIAFGECGIEDSLWAGRASVDEFLN